MTFTISELEEGRGDSVTFKAWDDYLVGQKQATFYHTIAWKRVLERSLGYQSHYLFAREGSNIVGILPLFHVKTFLVGNMLSSIPCSTYGGPVSEDQKVAEALVEAAAQKAGVHKAKYMEFRGGCLPLENTQVRDHYVTFLLDISRGPEVTHKSFTPEVRNRIRKATNSGLVTEIGGTELLSSFYDVYAHNMRDLGSPPQGLSFFNHILEEFDDSANIIVVKLSGNIIGGAILIKHNQVLSVPYTSSLRKYFSLCPNNMLYWDAILFGCSENLKTLDFGRSTKNTGTYQFKKQWKGECIELPYQYRQIENTRLPDINPYNTTFQIARTAWQHIPVPLARALGQFLIKQLAE